MSYDGTMELLAVGDRVREQRGGGYTGVVVDVKTDYFDRKGKPRPYPLPMITVRYDHSLNERVAPLSRWAKL